MRARAAHLLRLLKQHQPFTITGRLLLGASAYCLLAILNDSLAGLLSYLLWLLVFSFSCGIYYRPQLSVRIAPLPIVHRGEVWPIEFEVENVGARPAYDLECTLIAPVPGLVDRRTSHQLSAIAPGERVRLAFDVETARRGAFPVPGLKVDSLFPFAIFRFMARPRVAATLIVAPTPAPVSIQVPADEYGQQAVRDRLQTVRSATNNEYVRSIEYRPGMAVRKWDFPSWARLGYPTVRQFAEGTEAAAVLVVDTCHPRSEEVEPSLERVLEHTAGVIDSLDRAGQRITLVLVGDDITFHEAGPADQRSHLLTALAHVTGSRRSADWNAVWDEVLPRVSQHAALVVVWPRGHADVDRSLREVQTSDVQLLRQPVELSA